MDILFTTKYKIERKLEKYFEWQLSFYFKKKWLAEQNQDQELLNDCLVNIEVLNQKLQEQREKIREISNFLDKNAIQQIENILILEDKAGQIEGSLRLELESSVSKTSTSLSSLIDKTQELEIED